MTTDPRDRWPATPEGDLARARAWNRGDPDAIAAAALDSADRAKLPTATDDLIAFLRARLDEDEAVAKAADMPGVHPRGPWQRHDNRRIEDARGYAVAQARPESSEHIARWDPARALAEVEAKRLILDEHNDPIPDGPKTVCGTCHQFGNRYDHQPWPCMTLRLLAMPYAEHPDYREEWRPM